MTSTSSRDYSLTLGTINQTRSYRVYQNITYEACRHSPRHPAVPTTQQLNVDWVFALYTDEERLLRFAVTNQVGPVEGTFLSVVLSKNRSSHFFLFELPQRDSQRLLMVTECQAQC